MLFHNFPDVFYAIYADFLSYWFSWCFSWYLRRWGTEWVSRCWDHLVRMSPIQHEFGLCPKRLECTQMRPKHRGFTKFSFPGDGAGYNRCPEGNHRVGRGNPWEIHAPPKPTLTFLHSVSLVCEVRWFLFLFLISQIVLKDPRPAKPTLTFLNSVSLLFVCICRRKSKFDSVFFSHISCCKSSTLIWWIFSGRFFLPDLFWDFFLHFFGFLNNLPI